jgi:effector-binding domain-containing protein
VPTVAVRELQPTEAAITRTGGPLSSARAHARELESRLRATGVVPAGPSLLFIGDRTSGSLRYEIAVPLRPGQLLPDTVRFRVDELPAKTLVSTVATGPSPETTMTRLLDWLNDHPGYRVSGPALEIYLSGSDAKPESARTEVGVIVSLVGR